MSEAGRLAPAHLRRAAIVYIRQSSPSQLERNRESTDRQYALAERAVAGARGRACRPHSSPTTLFFSWPSRGLAAWAIRRASIASAAATSGSRSSLMMLTGGAGTWSGSRLSWVGCTVVLLTR